MLSFNNSRYALKLSCISLILRIIVIIISSYFDDARSGNPNLIKYTDIDYYVYHEAAVYVSQGMSPYNVSTYRYPPFLAWMLTPNLYLHYNFGKVLFSYFDSILVYIIYLILSQSKVSIDVSKRWIWIWTMNIVSINICTRGSSDAIINCGILSTLYFLQNRSFISCGVLYGFLIYWRLYPIIYIPTIVAYIARAHLIKTDSTSLQYSFTSISKFMRSMTAMMISAIISCSLFNYASYLYYGYEYLEKAIFYHMNRKDFRHNFSLYFYPTYLHLSYLGSQDHIHHTCSLHNYYCQWHPWLWQVATICMDVMLQLAFLPQLLLIIALSYLLFQGRLSLASCMFLQTWIFVSFNKVITAQYFTWFLCFIPIVFSSSTIDYSRYKRIMFRDSIVWLTACGFWLYVAYQLEYQDQNVFLLLWIACLIFHIVNALCIVDMIYVLKL